MTNEQLQKQLREVQEVVMTIHADYVQLRKTVLEFIDESVKHQSLQARIAVQFRDKLDTLAVVVDGVYQQVEEITGDDANDADWWKK